MDEYLVNRVMTASPQQLHLMVVEGCLRHARAAVDALESSDFDRSHESLTEARSYMAHLLSGLKPEADDEFMLNLRGLFKLAMLQLTQADITRDAPPIAMAIRILDEHRATWLQVMESVDDAPAPATPRNAVALTA